LLPGAPGAVVVEPARLLHGLWTVSRVVCGCGSRATRSLPFSFHGEPSPQGQLLAEGHGLIPGNPTRGQIVAVVIRWGLTHHRLPLRPRHHVNAHPEPTSLGHQAQRFVVASPLLAFGAAHQEGAWRNEREAHFDPRTQRHRPLRHTRLYALREQPDDARL